MLGGQVGSVKTLFVTCDPDRDTPPVIAEYLKDFHPSIVGITGGMDDVKAAAKLFRVYFKAARTSASAKPGEDYLVDHSIFYYLMDPEGRYVTHFGRDTRPEECAAVIKEALEAWQRRSPPTQV
jgi:protein SCO1/2